ncbi:UDP-2,4-diacetamido-2,4,6-trideoxy-beta-L-altropyranose hydrolase [Lysinibacillus sp. NPDC056959]|uniref:UDP-2,4-diacetamido-2,4, 6-trideoxy-beta-L-altropyranose hydrolase n=1 Tax=Lysinibacillus sp. NPDC056959 TaxID=3345981 RepID=UPI003628E67D
MNIVFRVDASFQIGSGHVMRCLTLANQLKDVGMQISFISRDLPGNMNDYIATQFPVKALPTINVPNTSQWIKENWSQDVLETAKNLDHNIPSLLIVDHYSLDFQWENAMYKYVSKIMVIDDLANRKHDCDILCDPTVTRKKDDYKNLIPSKSKIYCGAKFVIIRREFREYQKNTYTPSKKPCIHIFFGSMDFNNFTFKFTKYLLENFKNISLIIIISSKYKNSSDLMGLILHYKNRVEIYIDVENMEYYMYQADFAIGAPGTATWERACIGLPAIYLATNNNQHDILVNLNKQKLCVYLGKAWDIEEIKFVNSVSAIIRDTGLLKEIQKNCRDLVDGLGVNRLLEIITEELGDINI